MLKTRVYIYCYKSLQYSNLIVKIIDCAVKLYNKIELAYIINR